MTLNSAGKKQREAAAQAALQDIVWMADTAQSIDESELDGEALLALLFRNFSRLDPDNNGITRSELLTALATPTAFSTDEYAMLMLLSKYFETIINMSDDEPGPETRISQADVDVLSQFLVFGRLSLTKLHQWLALNQDDREIGRRL